MRRLAAVAAIATACVGALVVPSSVAVAAGRCPTRACATEHGDVAIHASHGGSQGSAGTGDVSTTGASNVVQTCLWHGERVGCEGGFGTTWSNSRQCYVKPLGGTDPANPPVDRPITQPPPAGATTGSGEWYGCQINNFQSLLWLTSPPPVLPTPGELAQQVVTTMHLAPIRIGIVPRDRSGSVGVIGLPVWMWVQARSPSTFGPITASATAGPMTVTATGKVTSIDWDMGDGTTVTCVGPGTAYRESYGARKSPTCGHVYTRTSQDEPGARYQVRATSHWVVDWAGGGQAGTITLDHVATGSLVEGELQVLTQ